jgi:hypothetical protein
MDNIQEKMDTVSESTFVLQKPSVIAILCYLKVLQRIPNINHKFRASKGLLQPG